MLLALYVIYIFLYLGREAIVVLPGTVQTVSLSDKSANDDMRESQSGTKSGLKGPGGLALKCNTRGTSFRRKHDLDQHQRSHRGENVFDSKQFGESFILNGNLKEDEKTQTGYKAFQCRYCYKGFRQKGHLNEHERIHTGEKPFACNKCDKRFNRKSLLTQHLKTHAGENRLTSDTSEQLSTDQGSIQKTLSTVQTGEVQFDRCFSETSSLQRHKTLNARGRALDCDQNDNCKAQEEILDTETERAKQTVGPCE